MQASQAQMTKQIHGLEAVEAQRKEMMHRLTQQMQNMHVKLNNSACQSHHQTILLKDMWNYFKGKGTDP